MILQELKGKKIIIYGTGHVARKFYKTIQKHGFQKQVLCFARSFEVKEGETFEGVAVYCFEHVNLDQDTLVCLAVHESIKDEIEEIVRQKTAQYLWVYPYLYELMFGEPEQKCVEADIARLLGDFHEDLRLGVRLAAIEQQDMRNTFGFEYYIKAQKTYCDKDTAVHRLKQFQRLMEDWKQFGYRRDSLFTFNRNYEVIDGNHRLAMAIYSGQKTICGNVYPTNLRFGEIHGYEPMLSKSVLLRHDFSPGDIEKLENIQKRYLQKYELGNAEGKT